MEKSPNQIENRPAQTVALQGELKTPLPCPFCGGRATVKTYQSAEDAMTAYVMCGSCRSSSDYFEDAFAPTGEAIAAWNRRITGASQ